MSMPGAADKIMHGSIRIGESTVMVSDGRNTDSASVLAHFMAAARYSGGLPLVQSRRGPTFGWNMQSDSLNE
jgi:uncharacterized glyoxalase superfamily protein PhnB